jgi:hypothetical protein
MTADKARLDTIKLRHAAEKLYFIEISHGRSLSKIALSFGYARIDLPLQMSWL